MRYFSNIICFYILSFSHIQDSIEDHKDEIKQEEEMPPNCICGTIMKIYIAKTVYSGNNVNCDGCRARIDPNENVYHCPAEKNVSHSGMTHTYKITFV